VLPLRAAPAGCGGGIAGDLAETGGDDSAVLLAGFVGLRLGILRGQSAPGATIAGYWQNLQFGEARRTRALGVWDGLRAGWLFVAVALFGGVMNRRHACVLGGMTGALILAGLLTAQDFSRAMTLVLPVDCSGWCGWSNCIRHGGGRCGGPGVAVALLVPAHLVMSNYTQLIHRLDQEWAALQDPPAVLRSETYEQHARQAVERRDFPQAEIDSRWQSSSPTIRPPERAAGIFYATVRHWAEARRDFEPRGA